MKQKKVGSWKKNRMPETNGSVIKNRDPILELKKTDYFMMNHVVIHLFLILFLNYILLLIPRALIFAALKALR